MATSRMLSFLWEVIGRPLVVSLVAKPDNPAAELPDQQHDEDLDANDDSNEDGDDDNVTDEVNGGDPNIKDAKSRMMMNRNLLK